MAVHLRIATLAALITIAGCSTVSDVALPGAGADSTTSTDSSDTASAVDLGTDPPAFNARSTGSHRGIAKAECNIDRDLKAARREAERVLKTRAAAAGADYVHVSGSGPLDARGFCVDGYLRIDGEGFARQAPVEQDAADDTADSLSGRLEELEALRERGLLNQNEYQQLRERVLDEAY